MARPRSCQRRCPLLSLRSRGGRFPSVTGSAAALVHVRVTRNRGTQLNQLRSTLPPVSGKNLPQYLRQWQSASLIVAVDRSDRMSQVRYCLSDPLGIAAVHLINALAESEAALEPEPKHRAR